MSITPTEREIEKASEFASRCAFDALVARTAITAPTGFPPRAWTQEEREACQATMRRIVERERAMREAAHAA